tara:strand:- start:2136 stop:2669 length:534 start_codon:yes stop_codon:yes gene_type:complete
MKVKIGPYPNHRWYHNYLYDLFGYTPRQKTSIKIDKYDTWSMDDTLSHIILPMLYQLAKTKHGSALVDAKDVPEHLRGDTDKDENLVHERWDWVMAEMIFAFESKALDSDWQERYYTGEHDTYNEPVLSSKGEIIGYEMKKGPNDTFKINHEGMKLHQDRITRGFTLFGKYYEGLWD